MKQNKPISPWWQGSLIFPSWGNWGSEVPECPKSQSWEARVEIPHPPFHTPFVRSGWLSSHKRHWQMGWDTMALVNWLVQILGCQAWRLCPHLATTSALPSIWAVSGWGPCLWQALHMAGQATVRLHGQQISAWTDGTGFLPCWSLKKMEANHSGPLSQALREIL